jgi:hypothetical protein
MRRGAWVYPTEHQEQCAVLLWAGQRRGVHPELDLLFAIPNGARVAWKQAKRLKAEGLAAGVPDLMLPVARGGYHGLFVEMKRSKGARLSHLQRWWFHALKAQGYLVIMAAGADRAIDWLEAYLRMKDPESRQGGRGHDGTGMGGDVADGD